MGLRDAWNDAIGAASRANNPLSWSQFLDYFSFNGQNYPISPYQTLVGDKERITTSFAGYTAGGLQGNAVVFACMLNRMMPFADVRFAFREMSGGRPGKFVDTGDGRNPGNAGLRLLANPWPGGTTGDLLSRMIQDVDIAGNSFTTRSPAGLTRLRPDWVTIVIAGRDDDSTMWAVDADVVGYIYQEGGPEQSRDPVWIMPEVMAHFAPYPDPIAPRRGMSWMTPIIREIDADSAASAHKLKFFENGATVNLALEFDSDMSKDMYAFAKESFKEQHAGTANAYKTLFLLGAKAHEVGSSFQQMDFKVTQGAGETRIAAAAGVPPVIVGLSEGLQGSSLNSGNYAASRRRFADGTLRPLWRSACGSLARIITAPAGAELWYDDRDVSFLKEDQKDAADIQQVQAAAIKSLIDAGWEPDSVKDAIMADDMDRLEHTGLFSVQLQPPMSQTPAPAALPAAPGSTNGTGEPAALTGNGG